MIRCLIVVALTAFGLPALHAQSQPDTAGVALPYTRQFDIRSKVNGRDYRLFVAVPPGYAEAGDTTRYRVLYVLDGNVLFPFTVEAHRLPRAGGWRDDPETIIVGIGYPVDQYYLEAADARNLDYTPTKLLLPDTLCGAYLRHPSGGGAAFLRVVREEIIPFVDARYRTTADRGIMGHSHGGTFALYALLAAPGLFRRYAALSPSLWWDRGVMFGYEASLARERKDLDASVFLSYGSAESPCIMQPAQRMADSLRAHRYSGLDVQLQVFPDENHMTVLPSAIGQALRALGYDPPPPPKD
ncbi:MAG TPA: alpha/beta hydrolase-fold protein [Gemmatimonadales bacterium]|nr:alpha/beta hydrolase-fold protein [Gemmatimonadales bacterium]